MAPSIPESIASNGHLEDAKVALFVAYCGAGFKGMQRNPGAATIEGTLEEALLEAGAISQRDYGNTKQLDWKRAARTDKGVSAAGQVVSGRFKVVDDDDSFVDRVNAHLPESIRLLGFKPVEGRFSAKEMCDSRRYEYLLPTFAFDPRVHRGRANGEMAAALGIPEFEFGKDECKRLNQILSKFVGAHNYHNFSWHVKAEDAGAERMVLSFTAEAKKLTVLGLEFVKCIVIGQSFMLYQIRKMIGLAVAVMRGSALITIIDTALRSDVNLVVPTAPELGLLLDECIYRKYNEKLAPREEEKIYLEAFRNQIEEFKLRSIYSHIAASELQDGVFARWLPSLNSRNYVAFLLPG